MYSCIHILCKQKYPYVWMYANTLYTKILPIYRRRYVIMCIVFDVLDITPHVTYFKTSDKYWEYVPWGVYNNTYLQSQ